MSDELKITPPVKEPAPSPEVDKPKFANKYYDQEAFDAGTKELVEKSGLTGMVVTEFKDQATQEAFYKQLETNMSQKNQQPAPTPTPTPVPTPTPAPVPDANDLTIPKPTELLTPEMGIADIIKQAGIDVQASADFYVANGRMPNEAVAAIQAVAPGMTITMINDQAAGMKAQGELVAQQKEMIHAGALQMVGTKEQLTNLIASSATMPNAEHINTLLKDPQQYQMAIREMQLHVNKGNNTTGDTNMQNAQTAQPSGGAIPYPDNKSWLADKNNPKYNVDAAFTKAAKARWDITPSMNFGVSDASRLPK